jgi:excisionase family DNA binding protein
MAKPVDLDANITAKQAAEILKVTVRTVHNLIKSGELTTVAQIPGATGAKLLDRKQVESLAEARAAKPKK